VSDVNANINISINSQQALGQLRALQSQISDFNRSVIASNVAAAASQKALTSQLIAQVGAAKGFSTSITNVESSVSRLDKAISKNKLSLGQYFRYATAASGTFGRGMKEHAEIMELAGERVKRLQTQYVALGQAQNGVTRAMAMRPLQLHNADAAIGIQRQQLFNKLMHDGSTSMVNWGKNTQWAGRQLMVGFTVPLTIFGGVAGKIFMDLEKQIVQFKRVYGDLQTTPAEKMGMVEEVKGLAKEFTKYGIAVSDTIALAAKAAATGATGADLLAQTTEATRLATLGQIDYQQALDSTIAMQTAFRISSDELAGTTNFLNAVENQTVTSLDDITQAIPLVAPVIKGLGGDVQDLAIFMTAMREGGISANEGANALKSGLASLINPTKAAREQLGKVGINIDDILSKNKGDLRGLVMEFGSALNTLGKFERQQTLAKMFGKYQFARLGALFSNVAKEGSQAQRVIDLTGESAKNLASIAEGELGQLEEAVSVKFMAAVEKLKLAIAPIGEAFLKMATPIIDFATALADKFNNLPEGMKSFITWGVAIGAVVIPAIVMVVGLFANFLGQMIKMGNTMRMFMQRVRGGGSALQYLESEELDAMAAAASLEGQTNSLTGALNVQRSAVNNLARAYGSYVAGANAAAGALPQGFRTPGRAPRRMATGGFVGGSGNKDSEPALLMPGEFVVSKKAAQQNADLLSAMNNGTLKRLAEGSPGSLFGGQELILAPHTMLAPGNNAGGFGMDRSFFENGSGFEQSLRASAAASSGVRLTDAALSEMARELKPYTEEIVDSLRLTAQEMKDAGEDATHISEVFDRARPKIDKTLAKMEKAGGKVAAAGKGIRTLAYPTDEEMIAQGERRVPAARRTASGALKFTQFRSRASSSLKKMRNTYGRMFGAVPQGYTAAHVTPENRKLLGGQVPLKGGMLQEGLTKDFAKAEKYIKKKSEEIRVAMGDPVGDAINGPRHSPHPAVPKAGREDGAAYEKAFVAEAADTRKKASGAQWSPTSGGWLAGGASPYAPKPAPAGPPGSGNGGGTGRFAPGTLPDSNPSRQQLGITPKETRTLKEKMSGMSGKLGAGMFAMDGLIFGMSMMENGVGEFAQKIMPAAFAAQGLAMMLPMLTNPIGLTIAALAGVTGIIWALKNNLDNVKESGVRMADAMISTSKQIQDVGNFFGNKNIVQQKELRSQGVDNVATMSKAQEYLQTESGKVITAGFSEAFKSQGVEQASQQFANKLATMMLQGSLTNKQAKGMADALEQEMGVKGVSAKVKGKLTELVGPDGKDVYKHPIQVSFDVQQNNQNAIEGLQNMTNEQIDEVMKNASERTKEDLMVLNASNEDLKLTPGIGSWEWFDIDMSWMKGLSEVSLAAREDTAKLLETLTATGAALGNNMKAGYDNAAAAAVRYADAQKRAENETDPKKKKYLMDQLKVEAETLKKMEKDAQKNADKNQKWFAGLQNSMQDAILNGNKMTLDTMFKGTAQEPWLNSVLDRTSKTEDRTLRYNVEMAMGSGQVSPFSLEQVYQMVGNDEEVTRNISYAVDVAGADKAGDLIDQLAQTDNKALVKEIEFDLPQMSKRNIIQVTEALEQINALPENVRKTVTTETTNTDDLIRLSDNLREFDKIPDKAKKQRYANYFERNFKNVKFGLSWFLGLPDSVQKSFLATYTIHFNETGGLTDAGRKAFNNAYGGDPGEGLSYLPLTETDKGNIVAQDDINAANAAVDLDKSGSSSSSSGSTGSDGSGSGGGGDKADPVGDLKKAIAEKMRLYLNMTQLIKKVKKAKQGFTKEILDSTKYNGSLADQLRDMNLSESLIADILSKGATDAKKIIDKLGKKGLREQNRKMLAGMRGEQVSGFVGQTRTSVAQQKAMGKLQRDGTFNQMDIAEIVSDDAQAQVLASLKVGSKAWKEYINKLKEAKEAAEDFKEAQDPIGYQLDAQTSMWGAVSDAIDTAFDTQIHAIERNHEKSINSYEDQIKAKEDEIEAIDREIEAIERLNDADDRRIDTLQRNKELISRQIEELERQNELDQRRINDLQREDELRSRVVDRIQHELDMLADQEEIVRKSYDDRISSLNDIIALNQHIIDQQKNQISLGQALSQGDVYAAAQAAAEMQASQVQYAQDQMVAGLEQGRDNAVGGLRTASGQTREEAEAQIKVIREQSYQTSLLIRDIEDQIYARNQQIIPLKDQQRAIDDQIRVIQDAIYARELDIQKIQLDRLQPRKDELRDLNDKLDAENDIVEKEKESVMVGGVTYEQWQSTKQQINDAFAQQEALHNLMTTSMLPGVRRYAKSWVEVGKAIAAAYEAQNGGGFNFNLNLDESDIPSIPGVDLTNMNAVDWQAKMEEYIKSLQDAAAGAGAAGSSVARYAGGKIGYSVGAVVGDGARDSVSALLTPGEFVVRKSMVDKYGTAMFEKINTGSFSIPRYSAGQEPGSVSPSSAKAPSNINAPVYNSYSVNVSASTNASADDIARTVIAKIKTIESSNIRRINGY
jgi:TP901 family phage tail tape measure protein